MLFVNMTISSNCHIRGVDLYEICIYYCFVRLRKSCIDVNYD